MWWIALRWPPEPPEPRQALAWWALQFTPRVVWHEEALLLEISTCERLWGGRRRLQAAISQQNPVPAQMVLGEGATGLIAIACARLLARGRRPPADLPGALPLATLSPAVEHLDILARMGCRTWADVHALPRDGLSRRFGPPLRQALDRAWALVPEPYRWLTLPEVFDQKVELPSLAETAPGLMWSASRLLGMLQLWLRARQRGVLGVELQWTLDLRRVDGRDLPPTEQMSVRTSEPAQDTAHLKRLIGERLARLPMAAPASDLRLRTLDTVPWAGASTSLLPDDGRKGDPLHQLVERLSERLGADRVVTPVRCADHRPEAMQSWQPAREMLASLQARGRAREPSPGALPVAQPDALYPPWLLQEPVPLGMQGGMPFHHGALRILAGPQRLEGAWWASGRQTGGLPAVRDYYIAESPQAGRLWIFRERGGAAPGAEAPLPGVSGPGAAPGRWYLHGIYA